MINRINTVYKNRSLNKKAYILRRFSTKRLSYLRPRANGRNFVGQQLRPNIVGCYTCYMLHPFLHTLLHVVAQILKPVKLWANNSQHSFFCFMIAEALRNNVGSICIVGTTHGHCHKWLIKRSGAYFIFPAIGAALIRERRLFQLQVKHWGEYREN